MFDFAHRSGGGAAPIMALHGSASRGSQWRDLDALSGDRAFLSPDVPGYGGAATATSGQPGLAGRIAPLIERIEATGEPVHLVGHSFGATLALRIAMTRPYLVRSLTLYEPAIFSILRDSDRPDDKRLYRESLAIASRLTASCVCDDPASGMRAFVEFWNGAGAWDVFGERLRTAMIADAGVVMRDFAEGDDETWAAEDLAKVTAPTMVMVGSRSPACALRMSQLLVEKTDAATFRHMPGLSHMGPIADPVTVNRQIVEWISNVEMSGTFIDRARKHAA